MPMTHGNDMRGVTGRGSIIAAAAAGLSVILSLAGCSSPRNYYESAVVTVNQINRPDADQAAGALRELDKGIALAKRWLENESDCQTPCRHDQTAYLIPLGHLAKARLYARLGQIVRQEEECWAAVQEAETYLGAHIKQLSEKSNSPRVPFADFSVFFRREKIRRNAFAQLAETYRNAGERDLEILMRAQVGFSDLYLRSPTAHTEEEYIRTIENSDWVRKNAVVREDIGHSAQVFLLALAAAAEQAGTEMQKSQLRQQAAWTHDPALKAQLNEQIAQLDVQMQENKRKSRKTMQEMQERHEGNLRVIKQQYQTTILGALTANFELLSLSEEAKNLAAYQRVRRKKEEFDNYILRVGFDREAAQALAGLRSSLDDLSREMQRRRRERVR